MFWNPLSARRNTEKATCLCLVVIAVAALFISPPPRARAQSDPAYSVRADSHVSIGAGNNEQDTGVLGNASNADASTSMNIGGGVNASVHSTASIGVLTAHATAYNVMDANVDVHADSNSYFTDTVRVVSGSLPEGTPVTVRLAVPSVAGSFEGRATEPCFTCTSPYYEGTLVATLSVQSDYNSTLYQITSYPDSEQRDPEGPLFYNTTVGSTLQLFGKLRVGARPLGTSHLNYDFTVSYYAEVTTPGAVLVSASGHDFAVPNTPAGANVSVQSGGANITFANVNAPGKTFVTPIDPTTAGALPAGYILSDPNQAFEINTTARYSGPINVCFSVPSVTDAAVFDKLRVLHGEKVLDANGNVVIDPGTGQPQMQLVDRTILPPDSPTPDFNAKTICAQVSSFSPFVIAQLGRVNQPPVARSKNIEVAAGDSCGASVSASDVDAGSYDPDGDSITLALDQAGPFGLGTHTVTLTATDSHGASNSSAATITVVDLTPPTIIAPPTVTAFTGAGATSCAAFISDAALGAAQAHDNCSVTVARSGVPAGNVFPVGTTVVTYTATDSAGNRSVATQNVTVVDNTAPTVTASLTSAGVIRKREGLFRVNVGAADNCDPRPSLLAVMEIPAGVGSFKVSFEREDEEGEASIKFDLQKRRITLEGGNEATMRKLLAEILADGGVPVAAGQVLRLRLENAARDRDEGQEFEFKFRRGVLVSEDAPTLRLKVTATDANGNSGAASTVPVLPAR